MSGSPVRGQVVSLRSLASMSYLLGSAVHDPRPRFTELFAVLVPLRQATSTSRWQTGVCFKMPFGLPIEECLPRSGLCVAVERSPTVPSIMVNEGLASRFGAQFAGWPASQSASGQVRQLASQSEDANLFIDQPALHPLVLLTLK